MPKVNSGPVPSQTAVTRKMNSAVGSGRGNRRNKPVQNTLNVHGGKAI